MNEILQAARWYVGQGISVIPVKADGSKSPAEGGWRKFADAMPTDDHLTRWFGDPKRIVGVGIPCGPASGNLVVLDFECDKESAYTEWLARLPENLRDAVRLFPTVTTPSGGKHVWVRLAAPQPGGKLARYTAGKTKIEIRGEGHQVLAPGCPAECHKTGKLYEWDVPPGDSDHQFPEMDGEVWLSLCQYAADCNEYQAPDQPRDREPRGTPAGEGSPGHEFNGRGSWADSGLFDAGWTWSHKTGDDRGFLTRPGKDTGVSASVGQVSSKERGHPYLYVWSTSVPDFASETPYSKFAVYAILKHGGDYSAAAKELARQGYGERIDQRADVAATVDMSGFTLPSGYKPFAGYVPAVPSAAPADDAPGELRIFKWMSELTAQAEDAKWLWEGYLARRTITMLSAHPKSGKTTCLKYLLKAFGGSVEDFLGQPIVPARVLYVTEEDESLWAERRDELGIGDHVGIISQPFKGRCTMPEWKAFLGTVCEAVSKHHFDLVILDTLSKLWPVREENDAGQVDEALMPLWAIKNVDAAVLIVHHSRKSGGGEFTSSRGSSGLPAFPDILMELERSDKASKTDHKRIVSATGRFRGIPEERLIELTPAGYVSLGKPDSGENRAERTHEWVADLDAVFAAAGENWTDGNALVAAVAARRGGKAPNRTNFLAVLGERFKGGELERRGAGHKGSPHEYRLPI